MIVFLHGVPETAAIWNKVRGMIDRESTALWLPGFGRDRPEGFGSAKDDYVAWVVEQLESIGEPVDLVGHDWGAGFTYRIATAHTELVRSWVADVGNIAHPDYVWHDFARIWQTEGDGEAFFESQLTQTPEERAATYELMGLAAEDALEMASATDETMGASILALYRSATPNVHADWGPWSPVERPGLVLHPTDDLFSDAALAAETAEALGARFETIDGAGHFWPYQAAASGAEVLERFWSTLG